VLGRSKTGDGLVVFTNRDLCWKFANELRDAWLAEKSRYNLFVILFFALSFCAGALYAASRLGRLPAASPQALRQVLRMVALVVLASVAFGALIGFAEGKRTSSARAWALIRDGRQRLDPKNKPTNPERWQRQIAEGEAKLRESESAGVEGAIVARGVTRTMSIALLVVGLLGSLALLRFRALR
jgi:hypothetical protein